MKHLKLIITICLVVSSTSLMAQNRYFNSQTLGMGRGGTAFIDGYHANFLNPANLMIDNTGRKPSNTVGIAGGLGIGLGGTLINEKVYNDYFTTGQTLSGITRENMLNDWFGANEQNTRDLAVNIMFVPVGFSHRGNNTAFSFATRVRTIQDFQVNKGFMELAFYGFDSQKFDSPVPVDFNNTILSYTEFSVGYAMKLPLPLAGMVEKLPFINGINLYAGVAPKYIVGIQSMNLDFNSTLQVNNELDPGGASIIHDFDYTLSSYGDLSAQLTDYATRRETDPNAKLDVNYDGSDIGTLGSGFGLDFGVTAEIDLSLPALGMLGKRQVLRVAMSVTDMGSVSYNKTPSEVVANSVFTFDANAGDESVGDYFDNLVDSLQNDVYGGFSAIETSGTTYDLPAMYNFGAALTLGKLTATLDYGVGFNDLGRNTTISRINLGAEYRLLNFIPLRVGTRIGGGYSTAYTFGTGVDFRFFDFTFAVSTVASEAEKGASVAMAYSGLVFRF